MIIPHPPHHLCLGDGVSANCKLITQRVCVFKEKLCRLLVENARRAGDNTHTAVRAFAWNSSCRRAFNLRSQTQANLQPALIILSVGAELYFFLVSPGKDLRRPVHWLVLGSTCKSDDRLWNEAETSYKAAYDGVKRKCSVQKYSRGLVRACFFN